MSKSQYVLSLCDYSGIWSQPYREAGYTVIQIDLKHGDDAILWPSKPSDTARLPRQYADIAPFVGDTRMVLCAPVCTAFSGAGAKHPRTDNEIRQGLALVDACIRIAYATRAESWALENPVGKLIRWLGQPRLRFQPCDYAGHADSPETEAYTKRTLLWGDFNAELPQAPVAPELGSAMWYRYGGKSERTKELRSLTPQGFARAFFMANP